MSEYDDTNSGALFKVDQKKSEAHPDMSGSINIDGTEYWLSAWFKDSKNGKKYISLSRGDAKEVQAPKKESTPDGESDDIW